MIILGFQKMTLLDYPNKVACTVFTGGCNLRCPFCHNSGLVTELDMQNAYDVNDVLSYIKSRKGLLDGVAITGGEPLIQKDIDVFIAKIKDMGFKVKLDTNGTFPDILRSFVDNELVDYVAVDVKNSKEKYALTVDVPNLDLTPIEETIDFLKNDKVDYEFRTTIVKEFHTLSDIEAISEWIKGSKQYFLQNFVDSGALIGENMHACSKEELLKMQKIAEKNVNFVKIRGI